MIENKNVQEVELDIKLPDINEIYADIYKAEKNIEIINNSILSSLLEPTAKQDLESILDGAGADLGIYEPLSFVEKPEGNNQDNCPCGIFKETWVDQWSEGIEGDCYSGHIYGKIKKGKWLKIPFNC